MKTHSGIKEFSIILIIFAVMMPLASCSFHKGLKTEFKENITLDDLKGVYENYGVTEGSATDYQLSEIIWPGADVSSHIIIKTIEVIKRDDKTLTIKGWEGKNLIKAGEFVEGKDFIIKGGRIKIGSESEGGGNLEMGALGGRVGRIVIGIDKEGHGMYQSKGVTAGMVFFLVPMAVADTVNVRFKRLK